MECTTRTQKALELADRLIELAEEPRAGCEHEGCLLLAFLMRDCGYKIIAAAGRRAELSLANGTSTRSHTGL
jgi:hypothetical protein